MRTRKLGVAIALAGTLCAVVGATPASAAEQFAYCDPMAPAGAALYGDGGAAAAVVAGRGTTAREPNLGQTVTDMPASAKGKAQENFTTTVPVYFHVITDGSTGALTNAQIRKQMDVLNNTFAGGEGGAESGFTFALAGVDRTDNAAWFNAKPGGVDEHSMKRALKRGGNDALNLYSSTAAAYLGWAYLPEITTKPGQAYLDGVVFDWESMPGTSATYAGRYDQGETVTHEVGHWLNLEHTFFGGCADKGDFVDDTPAEKTPTSGCPAGKDTCTKPGLDPIHNYMDYSYDSCYTEFTAGQVQRMRDAWLLYRAPR
jgi:hypothetical protein